LAVYGWLRTSRLVRSYSGGILAFCVFSLFAYPIDGPAFASSTARLNDVIGLLVVLGVLTIPLQARQFRISIRSLASHMRSSGFRDNATAGLLAFVLGQLIAFSVVPLVDELLGEGDQDRRMSVSRWAVRGFSLTLVAAVTFPSVSVAIDVFEVRPGQYLLVSWPLAIALLTVAIAVAWRSSPVPPEGSDNRLSAKDSRALTLITGYFAVILASVVALPRFLDFSYLGVVSLTVLAASGLLVLVSNRIFEHSSGHGLWLYAVSWWREAGSTVVIFFSGGLLLYSLQQTHMLEDLATSIADVGSSLPTLLYPLFGALVLVLFLAGVTPIVTIHLVALALVSAGLTGSLSEVGLTLALMVGNVAALSVSPFSALTNLRAIITGTDAFLAPAENMWFSLAVFFFGNSYIMVLAWTGIL
jgi:hypothetical protein